MLHSIAEVQEMIGEGKSLLLAGSITSLAQLPAGRWIAGSIPYFMDAAGGVYSEEKIFVTEVPATATAITIGEYRAETLAEMYRDSPGNGFSFLIVPN